MHSLAKLAFRFAFVAFYFFSAQTGTATAPFLWEIQKDGRTSYIMGTVHSSHPLVRDLPEVVFESLGGSSTFLPELELSPQNIGRMLAAAFDWDGSRIEERLPGDLYSRVRRAAAQLGLPELVLRNLSFEILPFLLAQPPDENFNLVIDVQLYQAARERGLEIVALETLEEQLAVFGNLDAETTIKLIEDALEEIENGYPSFRKLIETYAAGEEDAILELVAEMKEDVPEAFYEALLGERNRLIVERSLPHLEAGGAFIAVGLAHVLGEEGIVTLLEEHGYSFTRKAAQ